MMTIYFTLLILMVLLITVTILVFKKIWRTPSNFRNNTLNFTVSLFTILGLLLSLEVGFYTFQVHSDSFSFTLANQRWFQTYWHPINKLGYRDVDYTKEDLDHHKIVFVVGDSFVAGQGLNNIQDRFSNLLQKQLGKDWLVLNIAQVGWSTTEEYQAILSHPHKPAIIILSYFIDDIRTAANRSNIKDKFSFTELVQPPQKTLLGWLVNHSYLVNFYYWEWYRYHNRQPEEIYWQRLRYFYDNSESWRVHQEELLALVEYTRQHQIQLLPILFPNLISIDLSQPIISKVSQLFQSVGINTLDLTPLVTQRSPMELVVSRVDAHPNERVNAEVAEKLFKTIVSMESRN